LFRNDNCLKVAFKALRLSVKGFAAFCFLLSFKGNAQVNLVPNPSFEIYTSCPTSANQLAFANQWQNPTTWGTPDYYNGCSATFGVPSYCNCSSIYQNPLTGNAYTGIYCYDKISINAREYLQVELNDSLHLGHCYIVSFYTNLSNIIQIWHVIILQPIYHQIRLL